MKKVVRGWHWMGALALAGLSGGAHAQLYGPTDPDALAVRQAAVARLAPLAKVEQRPTTAAQCVADATQIMRQSGTFQVFVLKAQFDPLLVPTLSFGMSDTEVDSERAAEICPDAQFLAVVSLPSSVTRATDPTLRQAFTTALFLADWAQKKQHGIEGAYPPETRLDVLGVLQQHL